MCQHVLNESVLRCEFLFTLTAFMLLLQTAVVDFHVPGQSVDHFEGTSASLTNMRTFTAVDEFVLFELGLEEKFCGTDFAVEFLVLFGAVDVSGNDKNGRELK